MNRRSNYKWSRMARALPYVEQRYQPTFQRVRNKRRFIWIHRPSDHVIHMVTWSKRYKGGFAGVTWSILGHVTIRDPTRHLTLGFCSYRSFVGLGFSRAGQGSATPALTAVFDVFWNMAVFVDTNLFLFIDCVFTISGMRLRCRFLPPPTHFLFSVFW